MPVGGVVRHGGGGGGGGGAGGSGSSMAAQVGKGDRKEKRSRPSAEDDRPSKGSKLSTPSSHSDKGRADEDRESGKTQMQDKQYEDHFLEFCEKIKRLGGPDLRAEGWSFKIDRIPNDGEGENGHDQVGMVYIDAEGTKYRKRKHVVKALGLFDHKVSSREEAFQKARDNFKSMEDRFPLPLKVESTTIHKWGKIEHQRENFHSSRHIWPVGFQSSYKDAERDTLYENTILDGSTIPQGQECGQPDGPVFKVTVKKKGEPSLEVWGKSPKDAWRKALSDDKADEHFGFHLVQVKARIEGLRHAIDCKNYQFLEMRQTGGREEKKGEKKAVAKTKETPKKKKKMVKGKKAAGQKKENKPKLSERAKQRRDAAEKKRIAAEEKRLAAEEAARKKREQKEIEQEEQRWLARYPIEDMCVMLEEFVMERTSERGMDILPQRAAARAVEAAIEQGLSSRAAIAAADKAAESVKKGGSMEEALEKAMSFAEEVEDRIFRGEGDDGLDVMEEKFFKDELQMVRRGARVRMLFIADQIETWYPGFVTRVCDISNK
eukprot:747862-Hanusia_phi.AAC.7